MVSLYFAVFMWVNGMWMMLFRLNRDSGDPRITTTKKRSAVRIPGINP